MLFNTLEYLIFFLVVLGVSWLMFGLQRLRIWFILAASLYFYTSNNHWAVLILLFTTTVDYFICLALGRTDHPPRRQLLMVVSLVSNLGVLAYFKYFNFFGENLTQFARLLGFERSWIDTHVLLPVGISFYTFEALSYTIDVYRRKIPPERSWNRLAFLVAFFPHLVAGPIIRAADFFPQIGRPPRLAMRDFEQAMLLIVGGLVKKMVLADTLAQFVDPVFENAASAGTLEAWMAVYGFALQIYFDFSGYSDIAIGCARLLGFELPINFNRPHASLCITDFWRRWHMTLSTWLRDYLYVSMGGNRTKTQMGVHRNLMLTMLLGGLWHGAAWNFVLWGFLHGLFLCVERAFHVGERLRRQPPRSALPRVLLAFVTFQVVVLLWIPFRAADLGTVGALATRMFQWHQPTPASHAVVAVFALTILHWCWQMWDERADWKAWWVENVALFPKALAYAGATILIAIFASATPQSFIYFKF
jgi:alginate O-acetyltransferase complex protein AlgI